MPLRQLVGDTETTGFHYADTENPDRIIEVGFIEMIDYVETGRSLHILIDPEREIPQSATDVHGYTWDDLKGKPVFADVVDEILDFIRDDDLVIHNGKRFDAPFINAELARCGRPALKNKIVDTLDMARAKYGPGARNSLDALLDRFNIDRSGREIHGALIDSVLLARVYIALTGRDTLLHGADVPAPTSAVPVADSAFMPKTARQGWFPRRPALDPTAGEAETHAAFLDKLDDAMWKTFLSPAMKV